MSDTEKSESQLELISLPCDLSSLPGTRPLEMPKAIKGLGSRTVGSAIHALRPDPDDATAPNIAAA